MRTQQLIGCHVSPDRPLRRAAEFGADIVQIFLGDPQRWVAPPIRPDADELIASPIKIVVHAPYIINVASTNNKIRIPSRKLLAAQADAAAAIGAVGLVVHGGHVTKDDDPAAGLANWRKVFAEWEPPLPIWIENTAGGSHAMARQLSMLERLWTEFGDLVESRRIGFCLDTCHAFCGGIELDSVVEKVTAITGRIDLVHANGSRDPFGSGRDRHEAFSESTIPATAVAEVIRQAGSPAICENPGEELAEDVATLRHLLEPKATAS